MFVRGLFLVFSIWFVFLFQDSLCLCDRPSWVRVGWEILPEDLEQLKLGAQFQSNCLPYPLDQLVHCFTNLEVDRGYLEALCGSCKITFLLLLGLCARYLWSKLRRPQKTVPVPTSSVSVATEFHTECTCNVDKMLCRLVANTSVMMKYLKYVCHQQRKEARQRKLSKKREGEDMKDESPFPVCPYSHSSSMDTVMQEV